MAESGKSISIRGTSDAEAGMAGDSLAKINDSILLVGVLCNEFSFPFPISMAAAKC